MSKAAACLIHRSRIDSRVADVDELNCPVKPNHERGPVTHAIGAQNSICLRRFASGEIAEQRHFEFQLFGKDSLRGNVVGTDAKNEGVICLEFRDTSLVRREFLRSTTGESGGEEREDYYIFSFVV
jgi:hypothetical protein